VPRLGFLGCQQRSGGEGGRGCARHFNVSWVVQGKKKKKNQDQIGYTERKVKLVKKWGATWLRLTEFKTQEPRWAFNCNARRS